MSNILEEYGVKTHEEAGFCPFCGKERIFTVVNECYCEVKFDGEEGYTYQDEYGGCDFCNDERFCCQECNASFEKLPAR